MATRREHRGPQPHSPCRHRLVERPSRSARGRISGRNPSGRKAARPGCGQAPAGADTGQLQLPHGQAGREGAKGPAFQKFKPFFCYVEVEGPLFTIVKQTGSQRPAGRLWEDDVAHRLIFLGTLALGSEEEARAYGDDPKRDMAGIFERIGPFVWRLVIPYPQNGAQLDVFELTPVAEQPKE